jgi:hypothetical protein
LFLVRRFLRLFCFESNKTRRVCCNRPFRSSLVLSLSLSLILSCRRWYKPCRAAATIDRSLVLQRLCDHSVLLFVVAEPPFRCPSPRPLVVVVVVEVVVSRPFSHSCCFIFFLLAERRVNRVLLAAAADATHQTKERPRSES